MCEDISVIEKKKSRNLEKRIDFLVENDIITLESTKSRNLENKTLYLKGDYNGKICNNIYY